MVGHLVLGVGEDLDAIVQSLAPPVLRYRRHVLEEDDPWSELTRQAEAVERDLNALVLGVTAPGVAVRLAWRRDVDEVQIAEPPERRQERLGLVQVPHERQRVRVVPVPGLERVLVEVHARDDVVAGALQALAHSATPTAEVHCAKRLAVVLAGGRPRRADVHGVGPQRCVPSWYFPRRRRRAPATAPGVVVMAVGAPVQRRGGGFCRRRSGAAGGGLRSRVGGSSEREGAVASEAGRRDGGCGGERDGAARLEVGARGRRDGAGVRCGRRLRGRPWRVAIGLEDAGCSGQWCLRVRSRRVAGGRVEDIRTWRWLRRWPRWVTVGRVEVSGCRCQGPGAGGRRGRRRCRSWSWRLAVVLGRRRSR